MRGGRRAWTEWESRWYARTMVDARMPRRAFDVVVGDERRDE
jgi:hypothetical protein